VQNEFHKFGSEFENDSWFCYEFGLVRNTGKKPKFSLELREKLVEFNLHTRRSEHYLKSLVPVVSLLGLLWVV
jgi:hypothetical protein